MFFVVVGVVVVVVFVFSHRRVVRRRSPLASDAFGVEVRGGFFQLYLGVGFVPRLGEGVSGLRVRGLALAQRRARRARDAHRVLERHRDRPPRLGVDRGGDGDAREGGAVPSSERGAGGGGGGRRIPRRRARRERSWGVVAGVGRARGRDGAVVSEGAE